MAPTSLAASVCTGPIDRLARYLSSVGHPFIVIPASAGALSVVRGDSTHALASSALIALVFIAASVLILLGIRAGRFNDFDVSERERRPAYFAVLTAATLVMAFWLRDDANALRACLIASAVVGACGLLNRWTKVSLHTAFGLYAAGLWATWSPGAALVALLLAGAVAWSRIHLGRHCRLDVAAGALIGLAGGALLAFCP